MTYAIGTIVYGVNLHWAPGEFEEDITLIEECDLAKYSYSGNGTPPLYLGSEKGSIDECNDFELSELLEYQVTDEDKKIYETDKRRLLTAEIEDEAEEGGLSEEFKKWLNEQEPTLFITWGSS